MHVTSTVNSNTKSLGSIPVAVFSYEGRRKFVVKSKNYEDTVNYAKKAFGIPPETWIALSTITLDVCRGQAVEIDEPAYPHLWEVLDELVISKLEREAALTSLTPVQTPPVMTKGKTKAASVWARSSRSSHAPDVATNSKLIPLPSSSVAGTSKVQREPEPTSTAFDAEEFELLVREAEEEETHRQEEETGPSIEQLFDDDEKVAPPKPDPIQEHSLPSTPSPKTKKRKARSAVQPAPVPHVPYEAEKVPEQNSKKSKFKPHAPELNSQRDARPASPPRPSTPLAVEEHPAVDENVRLAIIIQGPGDDVSAQFKMRGKHPIHKILKSACVNFGLDFTRATLWLVQDDGDDDEAEPQCYELPRDQTALQCGIVDGSRLVIQIDEEDEEKEEEEEKD